MSSTFCPSRMVSTTLPISLASNFLATFVNDLPVPLKSVPSGKLNSIGKAISRPIPPIVFKVFLVLSLSLSRSNPLPVEALYICFDS